MPRPHFAIWQRSSAAVSVSLYHAAQALQHVSADLSMKAVPCGFADQGDRVAGRVSRADVAAVAVEALTDPRAANVTIELSSKAGAVPPAHQLSSLFEGLAKD